MPCLSFQKRFCARVESGEKLHSIRPRRTRPEQWQPGKRVHLYYAMRTKQCRKLGTGVITALRDVVIHGTHVEIDGVEIREPASLDAFAQADGFENWADFIPFFEAFYGVPWAGHLIKWQILESI